MKVGPKSPAEVKEIVFDFSNQLGALTLSTAAVSARVERGIDATPGNMVVASPVVSSTVVRQRVVGGVAGTNYTITCLATDTSGLVHEVVASLDVAK
jgi:hypothetical protein